jgi:type VI secretion system protein ImpH
MASEDRMESPSLSQPKIAIPVDEAKSRRKSILDGIQVSGRESELERELGEDPYSFAFFQAVRLLERLFPERKGVGGFVDPSEEIARFSVDPVIAFPPSEIRALKLGNGTPTQISVNFMGLTGPLGLLPFYYTLMVADRVKAKDRALKEFLDIFHHRFVSLFYRAWEKHRFTVSYERDQQDRVTEHLRDLVGLGLAGLQNRMAVRDESVLFYAGLLAPQQRSAVALEEMLEDYFQVPVEIEQFVGGWYPLEVRTQCRLGEERDASDQLGLGAVAGDEIWDQQARVRIRLGPLTREQYDQFLPTGDAYPSLRTLSRFFSNGQFDFEIQLVLARDEVPGCIIGADEDEAVPLGWCTWMRSQPLARDRDEAILTL